MRAFIIVLQYLIIFFQILFYKLLPKNNKKIVEFCNFEPSKHKLILIYVGYKKAIQQSDIDMLNAYRKRSAFIIFVTNYTDFDFSSLNKEVVDVFIDNRNVGWDFSQYQTATFFIRKYSSVLPEKIVYSNDSFFYLKSEIDDHIGPFLDSAYDLVGGFELSGVGPHSPWQVSSWLFSVSKSFFNSEEYQKFWKQHIPIKNKIHAIRQGEHKLTAVALAFSGRVKAAYDNNYLITCLDTVIGKIGYHETAQMLSKKVRDNYQARFDTLPQVRSLEKLDVRDYLSYNIHLYSPVHVFTYLLIENFGFPYLKKDLFYFQGQSYDSLFILKRILKNFKAEVAVEVESYFLLRGRFEDSRLIERVKIILGLR